MLDELECRDDVQGGSCRLRVRAQPGARREGLVGTWNGSLKLAVSAPPEDGRANESVARLLAALLRLRKNEVQLVAGARARNKEFRVALSCTEVRARLGPHLTSTAEDT